MGFRKKALALIAALAMLLAMAAAAGAEETPTYYRLGDTMEDFTVILADGTEASLSAMLTEKEMVLIYLWAGWRDSCRIELLRMKAAYGEYARKVGIVALSVEEADTDEAILRYREENGLSELSMGRDHGVGDSFCYEDIPVWVVIDRFGVICMIESGPVNAFDDIFRIFTGDDYIQSRLLDGVPVADGNGELASDAARAEPEAQMELPEGYALYRIYVVDEEYNLLDGAVIQVCDEGTCEIMQSEDGLVEFVKAQYPYEIHVLKAPEGYDGVSESYTLPAEGNGESPLRILLKKEK